MSELNEMAGKDILNEVRKLSIAFIIDHELTIRLINAAEVEDLGQAGYAVARDLSKAIYWTKLGEDYVSQTADLTDGANLYLHHELAPKGTRFKDALVKLGERI